MYFNWYEFYEPKTIKQIFRKDLNVDSKIFKIAIMSEIEQFDLNLLYISNEISKNLANLYGGEVIIDQNPNFFPNLEKEEKEEFELVDNDLYFAQPEADETDSIMQEISVVTNETPISTIITVSLVEPINLTVH